MRVLGIISSPRKGGNSELAVKEIRVEYRKEAKLGDEIFSYISRENERYTVLLADKDKKPYAVLAFLI